MRAVNTHAHATRPPAYTHLPTQKGLATSETHLAVVEPDQKSACTPDEHPEAARPIPDLPEIVPAGAHAEVNSENIPVHLLGLTAIKQGAPIGRGGMSTLFNGKYGSIPVVLKQAVGSVQMLVKEAAMISKMQHPNVIRAYGIWKKTDQEVFMVCVILSICVADIVVAIANPITTWTHRCSSSACTETFWSTLINL